MKIIAWNIGHSTYEKRDKKHIRIPKELPSALLSFEPKPDVIVLNEYVERPAPEGHDYLKESLRPEFPYTRMSDKQPSKFAHNRVFIASRTPIEILELLPDHDTLHVGRNLHVHAASNHLHVYLRDYELSIIGLRVPDPKGKEIDAYWDWLKLEVNKLIDRKIVLIGDFNANPLGSKSAAKHLASLIADGWQWKDPAGEEWSYISQKNNGTKSRIDHVLASHVEIQTAEYIIKHGPYNFMAEHWSDHAVLSVNVNCSRVIQDDMAS